jgi:predicted transcriptional regulator
VDLSKIENDLISEIKLTKIQAQVFLLVVAEGKMTVDVIAKKLGISITEALNVAKKLVEIGGFIDMSEIEYEAMHPRFTSVNMYRRMCERENIKFQRNATVDNIGIALEKFYDDVRTK